MDYENLVAGDVLHKYRAGNKGISLFINKQKGGRVGSWMPQKTSYVGYNNLMKQTFKPQIVRKGKEEGGDAVVEECTNVHERLLKEQLEKVD